MIQGFPTYGTRVAHLNRGVLSYNVGIARTGRVVRVASGGDIQAAVNTFPTAADGIRNIVHLQPGGTYNVNIIYLNRPNVTFCGNNAKLVSTNPTESGTISAHEVDGLEIFNVEIDGQGNEVGGLRLLGVRNCLVSGVYVHDTFDGIGGIGINPGDSGRVSKNVRVVACRVKDHVQSGGGVGLPHFLAAGDSEDILFYGCSAEYTTRPTGTPGNGFDFDRAINSRMISCYAYKCWKGFQTEDPQFDQYARNHIIDCVSDDCRYGTVKVVHFGEMIITNHTYVGCDDNHFDLEAGVNDGDYDNGVQI